MGKGMKDMLVFTVGTKRKWVSSLSTTKKVTGLQSKAKVT